MRLRLVLTAVLVVQPFIAQAQTSALATTAEARAWYIGMMRANGCEMNALEIRETILATFPYENTALRESGFMVGEAGMALHGEGLIEQTGFNTVRYTGPNGC